jgi:hypothetical protein
MKFTNHKYLTIGLVLSAALIVSSSSGTIGAVPPDQNSRVGEAVKVQDGATSKQYKRISKESKLQSELQEKYKSAFNRLLEDCSNWRPNTGNPKPIDTTCENLTQKMRIARTNMTKQDALVSELGDTIINSSERRKRLPLPTDAETLKINQVRIDNETKLVKEFDREFENTLNPILGNCRKGMNEDPVIPKPSDAVCKDLTEKVRTAGNRLIEQAELLEKLKDELPLAARKDQMPQCDGFYLPSGTFISLPDCPLGGVP